MAGAETGFLGETESYVTLKRVGEKMLLIARRRGAVCLIADNVDVCRSIGADVVHFDGYEIPRVTPDEAKQMLSIPVFASGGITLLNVDQVIEAGADGIAVVSSILNAPSSREAAEAFEKKILARILS